MEQIKTLFIIDDDKLSNHLVEKCVHHFLPDANVQKFEKPRFALITLETIAAANDVGFPDIIFLDLNMPVLNGWDFLKEFEKMPRYITSKCKVYIFSSSIIESDLAQSRNCRSVSDFISKPLTLEKLHTIFEGRIPGE